MPGNQIDSAKIVTDVITTSIEKVIYGIYKIGSHKWNTLKLKTGTAFENYLTTSLNKYSSIKTILYRDRPVPLYSFYVDIELLHDESTYSTCNINDLLNLSNFISIYGGGGTGKSTLLRHLFINTLTTTEYIPILIELRDIHKGQSLLEFIYETISSLKFNLEINYFEQSLDNGCYIFLFDGYDEVEESKRGDLTREIILFTDRYSSNHFILTSRPGDHLFNGLHKFVDFRVKELSKELALELANNIDYDQDIKDKFINELENRLYESHQSFCSNPLLLSLMLITFHEFAEIPNNIHIFYRRAFEVLYSQHDATKAGFKRKIRVEEDLSFDDFKKVLSAMSALSFLDRVITFNNTSLLTYINSAKKYFDYNFENSDYVNDLIESVCILIRDGLNYKFQHRSFQEYFAAEFILSMDDDKMYRVLKKSMQTGNIYIKTDMVLDLMMEIDRERVERVFLLPIIGEIINGITAPTLDERFLKFLQYDYESIELNYLYKHQNSTKEEESIVLSPKASSMDYNTLTEYIFYKYRTSNNKPKIISRESSLTIEDFKEYAVEDKSIPGYRINIDEQLLNNKPLLNFVLNNFDFQLATLEFTIDLHEVLKKKHTKRSGIRDIIFNIL